ncbi:reverse transcriptase domain-containing protein [Tanacetum coccineum]
MKLNPKKCSFAMEEGMFLGYVVTSEGIRANPEKAKAVMDMPSPKTPQADAITKKGETLMMYLAAANEAVSAVLLTERGGRQIALTLLSVDLCKGRKQLCFNGEARSGPSPTRLGGLRKLAKWVVELGAYGITYVPRVAIKGQVLADFLADTPTEISATAEVPNNPRVEDIPEPSNARGDLTPGSKAWRLYTDGASNNEGSGAGLILIAPDDVEYSYALRLNFSNSNNDAEYEALLAGLRIAKEMQVRDIHAFVDSKLVASQVEGSYEAKGARMIKYREKVLELVGAFNRFRITHIPRAENRKADALSKLAAVQFDHLSKEVLVEVLNERSVEAQEVNMVVEEKADLDDPIRNNLEEGQLPEKPRCPLQANYVIREVHMGSCGMHDGPRQVVAKAMNLGYFWPSMHRDARELIRACDDCQAHAAVPRLPKADMISVTSAWPFMKWGMDIVGTPIPKGP